MNLYSLCWAGKFYYDSGNDKFSWKIPQESLINLNIIIQKDGDTLVVIAHLREAHRFILHQPFDYDQYGRVKENCR